MADGPHRCDAARLFSLHLSVNEVWGQMQFGVRVAILTELQPGRIVMNAASLPTLKCCSLGSE